MCVVRQPFNRLTRHQSVQKEHIGDRGSAIFEAVSRTDAYKAQELETANKPVLPRLLNQKTPDEALLLRQFTL